MNKAEAKRAVRRRTLLFLIVVIVTGMAASVWYLRRPAPTGLALTAVTFAHLPDWNSAKAAAALTAFRQSCGALAKKPASEDMGGAGYAGSVGDWIKACNALSPATSARAYFERNFRPFAISQSGRTEGLFTGYYEPLLQASRKRHSVYQYPVYGLPSDLIRADLAAFGDKFKGETIAGRIDGQRLVPYATRAEIDKGGLESAPILFYADDPVAVFFLHIQGSGRVQFDDGSQARAVYAGKNGRPYTAIGRTLVSMGALAKDDVSLQSIRAWLKAHPGEAAQVMESNQSYTFFALRPEAGRGTNAEGTQGVPLTAEASLAVDNRVHPLGVPFYLSTSLPEANGSAPFHQLLIAQDTGGAIRGAIRGDIYWGTGARAEELAGKMQSKGQMYVLLPKAVASRLGNGKIFPVDSP